MSTVEENIKAYELLTKRGYEVKVPDDARCELCQAPHLPYHPLCEKCSNELDLALLKLDTAWIIAVDPFHSYDANLCQATINVLQAWRRRKTVFRDP